MSRRNLKQEHRRNKREPNVQDQLHLHKTTRNSVRPRPPVTYNAEGVACSYHSKRAVR